MSAATTKQTKNDRSRHAGQDAEGAPGAQAQLAGQGPPAALRGSGHRRRFAGARRRGLDAHRVLGGVAGDLHRRHLRSRRRRHHHRGGRPAPRQERPGHLPGLRRVPAGADPAGKRAVHGAAKGPAGHQHALPVPLHERDHRRRRQRQRRERHPGAGRRLPRGHRHPADHPVGNRHLRAGRHADRHLPGRIRQERPAGPRHHLLRGRHDRHPLDRRRPVRHRALRGAASARPPAWASSRRSR